MPQVQTRSRALDIFLREGVLESLAALLGGKKMIDILCYLCRDTYQQHLPWTIICRHLGLDEFRHYLPEFATAHPRQYVIFSAMKLKVLCSKCEDKPWDGYYTWIGQKLCSECEECIVSKQAALRLGHHMEQAGAGLDLDRHGVRYHPREHSKSKAMELFGLSQKDLTGKLRETGWGGAGIAFAPSAVIKTKDVRKAGTREVRRLLRTCFVTARCWARQEGQSGQGCDEAQERPRCPHQ